MKISVLQEELAKALSISIRFINTRSTLPILGNFLLIAEKSKLKIAATNLEMSVSLGIGAKVEEEGTITVPAKIFFELISNLNHGQIVLSQDKDQLEIISPGFVSKIPTIPPNDFPAIPQTINTQKSFSLSSKNLISSLSKVLFSSSLDEARPVLNGCLFIFTDNNLSLVTSDGFRLSKKDLLLDKKLESRKIIIPRSSLVELIKIASNEENLLFEFRQTDNQLIIKIGETYLSTRLIEGSFPDFQKIIPTTLNTKVSLAKNDFDRGVRLAAVFAQEGNVIKLSVLENMIRLNSESGKAGSQKNDIDAKVEGPTLEISFNFKFIQEFLSEAQGDSIEIHFVDPVSPSIFIDPKDKGFLHLIMPVRIQN